MCKIMNPQKLKCQNSMKSTERIKNQKGFDFKL